MTNEDIIKVAQAALVYFTTTDMTEEEEQEFLDYYRFVQDEGPEEETDVSD